MLLSDESILKLLQEIRVFLMGRRGLLVVKDDNLLGKGEIL